MNRENDFSLEAMNVFAEVCRLDAAERSVLLDRLCADRAQLRDDVESLLYWHDKPRLLKNAAVSGGLAELFPDLVRNMHVQSEPILVELETVPQCIGDYQVLRKIGEGGMGTVYKALQQNPRRTVALKVMRSGSVSAQLLRRFQAESHILGQLHHPGIAQIYEAGIAGNDENARPYFAMEFIDGDPLTKHADQHRLDVRERMELLAKVCDAVHHANLKGVVHRDLKPGNILVVVSTEDGLARPKVLDFGIARTTESDARITSLQTDVGQLIGTLPYMSPEQLSGKPKAVDSRSDVYALGVILYELLVNRLPIDVANCSIVEAMRAIQEAEPQRLSSISPVFRGDIATIVSKALEKQPERRYQSASEFASDIRRHLADEPIIARPTSAFYRGRKFAKRNKAVVGGITATFLALLIGFIGMAWRAAREVAQREIAQRQAYRSEVGAAWAALQNHDLILARQSLDETSTDRRGWEWRYLNQLADQSRQTLRGHIGKIRCAAPSPDNQLVASSADDETIRIWDLQTGALRHVIKMAQGAATSLAFSADHRLLLASFAKSLVMFDPMTGHQYWNRPGHATVSRDAFSPDGNTVAVGLENSFAVTLLESHSGAQRDSYSVMDATPENIHILPDGQHIMYLLPMRYETVLMDMQTKETVWQASASSMAMGSGLVVGDDIPGVTTLLDVLTRHEIARFGGSSRTVNALSRSECGILLARSSGNEQTALYDEDSPEPRATLLGGSPVFSNDAKSVITIGNDQTLKVWDARVRSAPFFVHGLSESVGGIVSPDAQHVLLLGWGSVSLFEARTGHQLWTSILTQRFLRAAAFSVDSKFAAVGGQDEIMFVLDVATGKVVLTSPCLNSEIRSLGWSPDAKRVAVGTIDGQIHLLQAVDGKTLQQWKAHQGPVRCTVFSPDGSIIATASGTGTEDKAVSTKPDNLIRIWDSFSGQRRYELRGHTDGVMCLCFNQDSSSQMQLASGSADGSARLWNLRNGECVKSLAGMNEAVWSVAFAPPNERLPRIATGSAGGMLRVWNPDSCETMIALNCLDSNFTSLGFEPDGSRLVGTGTNTAVFALETQVPPNGYEIRDQMLQTITLVDHLFQSLVFSQDIIAHLQTETSTPEAIRNMAIALVKIRGDQPTLLNSTAWGIARVASNSLEKYRIALRASELACKIRPNDYNLLNTLGVAQYRMGDYRSALRTLQQCDAMHFERNGESHPVDIAVLAMAQWRMGLIESACRNLSLAQQLMQKELNSKNEENQSLFHEAETLVDCAR